MARFLRASASLFSTALFAALAAAAAAQTPPPEIPPQTVMAQGQTPPAPPARPAPSPEQQALRDAQAVKDPAGKIEALRKFQADYPKSVQVRSAESSIFTVLATSFKDREAEILASIQKQIDAVPASMPPDMRLRSIQTIATTLVENKILLDRAESLIRDATAKLDRAAFIAERRATAERMRKSAEERAKTQAETAATPAPLPPVPTDQELGVQFDRTTAGASELLGRIYLAKGDAERAERELKAAFAANPTLAAAPLELAKMASARGEDKQALEYYLALAVGAKLKRADEASFIALFRKVHGDGADLEAALDKAYNERFPNPVDTPEKYTGPRTRRVALLEMFTGAACPPCVSADLALDAVMERYPSDAIAVLAYHAHIPGPDPMVVPGSDVRRLMYAVRGVPTFNVDGALARLGGGARENTPRTYETYTGVIDKAIRSAPAAEIAVKASLNGSKVTVWATASNIADGHKDLRLHLVLAEKHLRYSGENGIRFHPFVVRDVAGEKSGGFPIADPARPTSIEHVFDLAAIPEAMTKSLADEIAKRRKDVPADAAPREYRAEGRAMTAIDPTQLVVVAFVQEATNSTPEPPAPSGTSTTTDTAARPAAGRQPTAPTYKVLQAAWTTVPAPTTRRE